MKTITIEGKFKSPANNSVIVTVKRVTAPRYSYTSDELKSNFSFELDDLASGVVYNVIFSGSTMDKFNYKITGDITESPTKGEDDEVIGSMEAIETL